MAVEKIKRTLASLLERPEYLLDTPRNSITRKAAKELLESMESDSHGNLFREFAIGLETAIKKAFPTRMPKRSSKEKVLSLFHSLSFCEVDEVWEKLYHQIGKDITVDRMMKQYTNDKIFTRCMFLNLLLHQQLESASLALD